MFAHTNRHRRPPERRWRMTASLTAVAAAAAVSVSLGVARHGPTPSSQRMADFSGSGGSAPALDVGAPVQDAHQAVAVQRHATAVLAARTAARQARERAKEQAARRAARVAAQAAPVPATAAPPVYSGGVLSPAQIGALWLAAGGSAAAEQTAICIAEAESGGNTQAVSSTADYGVFQIHDDPAALDPMVSAEAAVSMSGNGASWAAWTTAGSCGV